MKVNSLVICMLLFGMMHAEEKKTEIAQVINNSGKSVNVKHTVDITPYTKAVISTHLQKLPSLQKMLYQGIVNNSTKDIIEAVELGADVNEDIDGRSPLYIAMSLKMLNAVEVLKKYGAQLKPVQDMLYRAILNDSEADIKEAVRAGANINRPYEVRNAKRDNKKPIKWAIALAKFHAVESLLKCEVDLREVSIQESIQLGDINSALALLRAGIKIPNFSYPHQNDQWHRMIAQRIIECSYQIPELCLEFLQELINQGYNIHFVDASLTIWSIIINDWNRYSPQLIALLMKNGANPNQAWNYYTPLFYAIQNNNKEAVTVLLDIGADINQQITTPTLRNGYKPHTPLSYAMEQNYPDKDDMMALLRKYSARGCRRR